MLNRNLARRKQEQRQQRLRSLAEAYVLGFAWFVIAAGCLLPFLFAAILEADKFGK